MTSFMPRPTEGYHYESEVESTARWRVLMFTSTKLCRFQGGRPRVQCRRPAIAEVNRDYRRRPRGNWWAYCVEHLAAYRRYVDAGRVFWNREVPNQPSYDAPISTRTPSSEEML